MSWHNSRNRSSPQHERYTFERKVTKWIPPNANRGSAGSDKDSDKDRVDELDGGVVGPTHNTSQTYAGPPSSAVTAELEKLRRDTEDWKRLLEEANRKLSDAADYSFKLEGDLNRLRSQGSDQSSESVRRLESENKRLQSEYTRAKSESTHAKAEYDRLHSELNSRIRQTEEQYSREITEIRNENARLRDEQDRIQNDIHSNTGLRRSYEQLQVNFNTLRDDHDRLRHKSQQNERLKESYDQLSLELDQLRATLRDERQRSGALQDELDRIRAEQHAAEVERQVTVEREGMRARADLLRKVYDNHKAVAGAVKTLRTVRGSDAFMRMKNSTRDLSPKELVAQIEQTAESLQKTVQNSTHIIKTYFSTNEKLTCGMSAEWYKNEAGKPRALEERVTTTTVITTRPVSPGLGGGAVSGGSPTYPTSTSPTQLHSQHSQHTRSASPTYNIGGYRSSSPQPVTVSNTSMSYAHNQSVSHSTQSPTANGKY